MLLLMLKYRISCKTVIYHSLECLIQSTIGDKILDQQSLAIYFFVQTNSQFFQTFSNLKLIWKSINQSDINPEKEQSW